MNKSDFDYNWGNGLVKLNSLSPNEQFYYQIRRPWDKYWGHFVTKISVLTKEGKVIYYNSNKHACPIHYGINNSCIKYATFSSDGNFLFLSEQGNKLNEIDDLVLDLINERFIKIQGGRILNLTVKHLENDLFDSTCLSSLEEDLWKPATKNWRLNRNLAGRKIWNPTV